MQLQYLGALSPPNIEQTKLQNPDVLSAIMQGIEGQKRSTLFRHQQVNDTTPPPLLCCESAISWFK